MNTVPLNNIEVRPVSAHESIQVLGYKGFEKDLKCRDYQFTPGVVHEHTGKISLCGSGFHFCTKLDDVHTYYSFDEKHRFFKVAALGSVIMGDTMKGSDSKCVTNRIKLLEEISLEDIMYERHNQYILAYLHQLQKLDKEVIIGGSLALMLQGYLPWRNAKDIDLVLPHYKNNEHFAVNGFVDDENMVDDDEIVETIVEKAKEFVEEKKKDDWFGALSGTLSCKDEKDYPDDYYLPSGSDVEHTLTPKRGTNLFEYYERMARVLHKNSNVGIHTDVYMNPECKFTKVKYRGKVYIVQLPEEILKAKFKYAIQSKGQSSYKHAKDCIYALGRIFVDKGPSRQEQELVVNMLENAMGWK